MAPSLLPRRALVPVLVPVLCLGLVLGAATSASAADLVDPATGGVIQGLESDAVVSVSAGSEPQFVTVPVAPAPTVVYVKSTPVMPLSVAVT